MKKIFTILLLLFIGACTGFFAKKFIPVLTELKAPPEETPQSDSLWVLSIIQDYTNPSFANANDVLKYKRRCSETYVIDSIIENMPDLTLLNVAEVLINREGITTKRSIVDEYSANKSIYDNLPVPDTPTTQLTPDSPVDNNNTVVPRKSDNDTVHSPRDKPHGTIVSQKDTVIGGKLYKQTVKQEVSYE